MQGQIISRKTRDKGHYTPTSYAESRPNGLPTAYGTSWVYLSRLSEAIVCECGLSQLMRDLCQIFSANSTEHTECYTRPERHGGLRSSSHEAIDQERLAVPFFVRVGQDRFILEYRQSAPRQKEVVDLSE